MAGRCSFHNEKIATDPPRSRAGGEIMHCFLLAEKLDTMCPLSECAMATIRYVRRSFGTPAAPQQDPPHRIPRQSELMAFKIHF